MQDVPTSFEWQLSVQIDSAVVDIEVNQECVEIEVNDFEADTCVTFDRTLLHECLDLTDLYTLRRLCNAEIAERESNQENN